MGKTDLVGSDCKANGVCTELRIRNVDVYATRVQPHQKLNRLSSASLCFHVVFYLCDFTWSQRRSSTALPVDRNVVIQCLRLEVRGVESLQHALG